MISNCVINLCPEKEKIFSEIWRVLKPGGELYFSDMYADRRVPESFKSDPVLWGEGLAGAMYIEDFRRLMAEIGFKMFYITKAFQITSEDKTIQAKVRDVNYYGVTVRAFKLPGLIEDREESYAQSITYKGTIEGHPDSFMFDSTHNYLVNEPKEVSLNQALIIEKSRLREHFTVTEKGAHQGLLAGVCTPMQKLKAC